MFLLKNKPFLHDCAKYSQNLPSRPAWTSTLTFQVVNDKIFRPPSWLDHVCMHLCNAWWPHIIFQLRSEESPLYGLIAEKLKKNPQQHRHDFIFPAISLRFRAPGGPAPSPSSAWHCSRTSRDPWWPTSWQSDWWHGPAAASAPRLPLASVAGDKKKWRRFIRKLYVFKKLPKQH